MRLLREPEVLNKVGVSTMTLRRWEAAGRFPRRVHVSKNVVGWVAEEVDAFLTARAAERESPDHGA